MGQCVASTDRLAGQPGPSSRATGGVLGFDELPRRPTVGGTTRRDPRRPLPAGAAAGHHARPPHITTTDARRQVYAEDQIRRIRDRMTYRLRGVRASPHMLGARIVASRAILAAQRTQ